MTARFSLKGIWQKATRRLLWIWQSIPILLKKLPKKTAEAKKIAPIDEARGKLIGLKGEVTRLENQITGAQGRIGKLSTQIEDLESAIEKGEKTASLFAGEYKNYLDKYEPNAEQAEKDKRIEAMFRNRPKLRGDVERV